jgi:hypothetical protein
MKLKDSSIKGLQAAQQPNTSMPPNRLSNHPAAERSTPPADDQIAEQQITSPSERPADVQKPRCIIAAIQQPQP